MQSPIDLLILSNGPGELATWVKPVVQSLRQRLGNDRQHLRISIVLSPDAHASGQEADSARNFPEVDRVQAAAHFFPFLLWGKTQDSQTQAAWDWRSHGIILFLGGDQAFPILLSRRLGYKTLIYAEREARWHRWGDRFAIMTPTILAQVAAKYRHKFTVVGDLMVEAGRASRATQAQANGCTGIIGLLPGSKPLKLVPGVPLTLAIADHLHAARPDLRFVLPLAPTVQLNQLADYANPQKNAAIAQFGGGSAQLVAPPGQRPYLQTPSGLTVEIWTEFPAYELLATCDLCLTGLGANTAELGALAVPMLVLMPTQQMNLMKAWDGLPGLLVRLPGVGDRLTRFFSYQALKRLGRLAWPNIWAQAEIVPELVGELQPAEVAAIALDYLNHPDKLAAMRAKLRQSRGEPGAAEKLVQIVVELLAEMS